MKKIIKESIENLNARSPDVWDAENLFHWKADISRIGKILYHYEIYKKIIDVPGDIMEFGVFKGVSLVRWLTYRSILENNFSRKVYGFDSFGKFPDDELEESKDFLKEWKHGDSIKINELKKILLEKKFENFELIEGNVLKTLNNFLKGKNNLKIALLHLDLDLYKPTKFVIDNLFDKISSNGIILIDNYSMVNAETRAIDEFLKTKKNMKIEKLNHYDKTSYYLDPKVTAGFPSYIVVP